jgi:hypothetical protein
MGKKTPNTCSNKLDYLPEQSASDDTTNAATRTGHPSGLEASAQCATGCTAEDASAATPFSACIAGQNAISEGHRFSTTGAPAPPWLPTPKMASPAFTITGINLSPSSNNQDVWANMAYLPLTAKSLVAANFHLLNALGRKQPLVHFH